MKKKSNFN